MKKVALAFLAAAFIAPLPVQAQSANDFLGEWESTVETQRGTFTTTYSFWMDGDMLKGSMSGRMGETVIDEVKFEEGKITFSVTREMRGNSMTLTYTAWLEDGVMQGTMSTPRGEREFTATRVET